MGARVRDADGSIWEQRTDDEWYEPKSGCWLPTREVLDLVFGPLSEVDE